jgi:hypothetical protein
LAANSHWEKTVKLRILNPRFPAKGVQIFDADTGEDIGCSLGVQKVWYNDGDSGLFL